ncbi:MAG: hypothetical protein RI907_3535 [Pseudomonadota bacterium]|jgi:uncharacterized protein involved in exopolysaccharide biosynthesis
MNERPVQNPMKDAEAVSTVPEPKPQDEPGVGLLDLFEIFAPRLGLIVLLPLLVTVLNYGYLKTKPDVFTSTARFMPPPQQQSNAAALLQGLGGTLGGLASASGAIKNPADQYVAMLRSRSIQDALIDRFKLMDGAGGLSRERVRTQVMGALRVEISKEGLIEVSYTAAEPKRAAEMANASIEELRNLLGRLSVTEAQQRRVFFEKHLREAKDNLIRAEQALQQVGVNPAMLRTTSPQFALEGVARLTAQIAALEVRMNAMRGYMTDASPEMQQARAELNALRGQLSAANKDMPVQGADRGQYVARYREFKYQETLFELFARQYELARVDESREGPAVQVLDSAVPPEVRSGPKRLRSALVAGGFTLLALLVQVFVSHRLRLAAKDDRLVEQMRRIKQALRRSLWF